MTRPDWCPDDVLAAAKKAAYAVEGTHEEGWITSANGVDVIARAILAERERCAKVAEAQAEEWVAGDNNGEFYEFEASACLSVAAAIRAGATQ